MRATSIGTLEDFCSTITEIVNRIVRVCAENTEKGTYIVTYKSIHCIPPYDFFCTESFWNANLTILVDEVRKRAEVEDAYSSAVELSSQAPCNDIVVTIKEQYIMAHQNDGHEVLPVKAERSIYEKYQELETIFYNYVNNDAKAAEIDYVRDALEQSGCTNEVLEEVGLGWLIQEDDEEE